MISDTCLRWIAVQISDYTRDLNTLQMLTICGNEVEELLCDELSNLVTSFSITTGKPEVLPGGKDYRKGDMVYARTIVAHMKTISVPA